MNHSFKQTATSGSRYYYCHYLHSECEETKTQEGTKFTQGEIRVFLKYYWGNLEIFWNTVGTNHEGRKHGPEATEFLQVGHAASSS